jgi:hypothetical protein
MYKYRYELDEKERVKYLLKDTEENQHLNYIELPSGFEFRPYFYGVKNNTLYEIGFDEDYIKEQEKINKIHRIKKLKKFLEESDWKVIVNSELIQNGLQPKYLNLHEERQAWRDEINALEFEIAMLG